MSVTDYISRTYDASAFQDVPPPGEVAELTQALANSKTAGSIVTGVQKVAQAAVIELLTPKGSKKFDSDAGTDFITKLLRGELRTELDVFAAFNFAATRIIRKFRADRKDSDPDDEVLTKLSLDRLALSGSQATLTISVTTLAGSSRKYIVPLEVLP